MADEVELHPVQTNLKRNHSGKMPKAVTMRAYEVYTEIYGEQEALVTGGCRGGLGVGELIAFLYARSFPKAEWRVREREAFRGMDI